MADVLGVAASVAGLMTIADSIVRKGFKFIKDVKEAEKSVERLVEEVNNLSGVLHSLNNVVERLEEDGGTVDPLNRIHYIESCYKTLKKIQDHFDEAIPATPLSRGEKLKWPLKKAHTKELLDEIGRHKATMNLAMSARQMTTLIEILAGQDNIRDGLQGIKLDLEADRAERREIVISEKRRQMLRTFGEVNARKWQDSNIRLRQPGTGVWFTDGAEFKNWLSTDESKLWINGIPGAGKTILISTVIQEIEEVVDRTDALAFFYCDYKDSQTQDPLNILGALAKQLIIQDERCFTELSEFCRCHTTSDGSTRKYTSEELCGLIRSLSKYFHTTMIVVDGLDEITHDRAGVTRDLSSLNSEGGKIKTLFASRPEVDIGYELGKFVQVSIAAMSSDLRLYVASEIERRTRERRLRIRDPTLKDHIMTTLVEGADGMFRWVSCQMDYLCECNNDRDRREALKKLPPDLPSSYERILERVNRSSKENQTLVVKTLHWIVYADHDYVAGDGSSLTTEMLLQALAIRDGEEFFDKSSMASEEELLHWCSSLVRRSNSGYLELAHFTVKEFLQAIDPVHKPQFRQYCLTGDHTILAKACLNFILCPQFDKYLMMDYDGGVCTSIYKSIRYACENWSYHVHNSSWDDIQGDVNRFFDIENNFNCWKLLWASCYRPTEQFISKCLAHPQPPSPLHWAALFGLDKLCARLLQSRMNPSQQSSMGTPLFCAMLSHSVTRDQIEGSSQYDRSWQPQARQSVIRQLLEAGLDLELPVDEDGKFRPLTIALELESWPGAGAGVFIVSMLVNAGASFSDEDFVILRTKIKDLYDEDLLDKLDLCVNYELCGIDISRLIEAATRKRWKRLMRGAEFEFFSFVLEIVSCDWPMKTFERFLEIDFNDFFPGSDGSESWKILRGETADWKSRLLHVLSDAISFSATSAEEATSSRQRALLYAVSTVNTSVVSLLFKLDRDLDASYRDMEMGHTLLHLALEKEETLKDGRGEEVAKILILNGADVMLRDMEGRTCIQMAASSGCSADYFELFWKSALRGGAFHEPNNAIEEILDAASWSYSYNEPVLDFLWEEFFQNTTLPENTIIAVAVGLDSTQWLKNLIDNVKDQKLPNGRAAEDDMGGHGNYNDANKTDDKESRLKGPDHDTESADRRSRELQAFRLAATSGHICNFKFLLERGLPTSHQDQDGNTVLHCLATSSHKNKVAKLKILLDSSQPKLDIHNKDNLTPLALAIQYRNVEGLELLLDAGANMEIAVMEDETALHIACQLGNLSVVEALLQHGCQTWRLNGQGQTPKDVALACGHHYIAATIQNTINAAVISARVQPETSSSKEQLLDTASPDFSPKEDQPGLPLLPKLT